MYKYVCECVAAERMCSARARGAKKGKCENKKPQGPRESEDVSKCSSLAVNVHE